MNARDTLLVVLMQVDPKWVDRRFGVELEDDQVAEQLYNAVRDEVLAEGDLLPQADVVAWLVKKAREFRSAGGAVRAAQADAIGAMASKVERGAVRPDNLRMLPADFFQPGHTYTREHHGHRIEFHVAHVATAPGGSHPTAFGWRNWPADSGTGWEPTDADDLTGWTDITNTTTGDSK